MFNEMAKRKYRQKRRAEKVEQTHRNIVEAAMRLHETLGPADTSISAIAEHAGVQRLTVYRHFKDEAEIFEACTSHWLAQNPPPNPAPWAVVRDPRGRIRRALNEMYAWYSQNRRMLHGTYRDIERVPALKGPFRILEASLDEIAVLLLKGTRPRKPKRAAMRHALEFPTWESLERQGLSDKLKADTVEKWIAAT